MRSTVVGMLLVGTLAASLLLVPAGPAARAAAPTEERLVDQVRKAILDGKAYLRRQQKDGVWEIHQLGGHEYVGGTVSLAVLSLLTCGVTDDDREAVKDGLDYLRNIRPKLDANRQIDAADTSQTYTVALQTMVYALAGHPEDRDRIQDNVDWIMAAHPQDRRLDLRQAGRPERLRRLQHAIRPARPPRGHPQRRQGR